MVFDEGVDDLPLVMEEIVEIMGASGATLTLHADGQAPALLFCHASLRNDAYQPLLTTCHQAASTMPAGKLVWRSEPGAVPRDAAIMSVERVPGHSRLAITLMFEGADDAVKARAESIHGARKPFAIGYFRLWQLARLHMRRYNALEAALNCTQLGVILVDRSANIIFGNEAAKEILDKGDGLESTNGQLRATHLSDAVNLQAALMQVANKGQDSQDPRWRAPLLAFRRRKAPSLVATIIPMRTVVLEPGDVAATIYLVDPEVSIEAALTALCRLYGLSPVETRMVCHLAAGDTIAAAAEKMHIREHTARSYMKQIFVKTATNRQTELVILMLSSLSRMKDGVLQEALTERAAEKALAHFS